MRPDEKLLLFRQIVWDYKIPPEDIEAVLHGEKEAAGHLNREAIFLRLLESYSWFTILQLLPVDEIKALLNEQTIKKLRTPGLRKNYEYVRQRLQEIIPTAG